MNKLTIAIIEGTKRVQRKSIHAAELIFEVSKQYEDIESILVDPNDFNFPGDGNDPEGKDPRYTEITAKADGFFIVSPEYNHLIPGSLKRMLDSELKNYIHKPVAFAGVSSGPWGGVRAIEALVTTVREMGMVATFTDVQFPKVQEIFDEQGKLKDDAYVGRIKKSFDELIWMAKVLKHGRENVPGRES
jgi:NAD(P)H-dependent FMN reductase